MTASQTETISFEGTNASPLEALRDLAAMALLLLAFTIPWEDELLVEGFGTFSRGVGIAAFLAGLLAIIATGRVRTPKPVHLVLLALVLWNCLSLFWTIDFDGSWPIAKSYAQLLAMVWLMLEFASGRRRQIQLMQAYVIGTYVSAISTVVSYLSDTQAYWQRHVASGFDPNDLCVILALSIPMSFYLMTVEPAGFRTWLWRLHPGPVLFAAFLTASRGGFLAICAALLIVPLLFAKLPRNTKLLSPALAALLLLAVAIWTPVAVFQRLSSIPGEITGMTFGERGDIWKAGWEVFRQHPVIGVGVAAFAPAVAPVLGEADVAHNTLLELSVETGLLGLLLFGAAVGLLFDLLLRLPPVERRLWSVLLLTWLCGALSLSWAHRKPTWFLFGLLAVQASSLCRQKRFVSYK
jgi:O-antigen ligase